MVQEEIQDRKQMHRGISSVYTSQETAKRLELGRIWGKYTVISSSEGHRFPCVIPDGEKSVQPFNPILQD